MHITLPQVTQRTPNLDDRVGRYESVFTLEGGSIVVRRAILHGRIVTVKNHRFVPKVLSPVSVVSRPHVQD